jgi:hypothetical protein
MFRREPQASAPEGEAAPGPSALGATGQSMRVNRQTGTWGGRQPL